MSMRGAFDEIIGKRIKGVIVKEGGSAPKAQIFLLFSDDTYFEFYGEDMRGCNGVDRGDIEIVRSYMAGPNREITFESVDERISDRINLDSVVDRMRNRVSKIDLTKLSPSAQRLVQDSEFIEAIGALIPETPERVTATNKIRKWLSSAVLIIGSILVFDELRHPVQTTIREWGQIRTVVDTGATFLNAIGVGLIVAAIFYVSRGK